MLHDGDQADKKVKTDPSLAYGSKSDLYFRGARRPFVDILPPNPTGRLLEIGCGAGKTSAYALAQGKCGWCCGVELCEGPAAEARTALSQVIVGDVEEIRLELPSVSFDVLLMSEVLEHLRNPGEVLARLRGLLRPGALVIAGSPNVCHHTVIRMLLSGRWDYQLQGIMDETHLRWFTPATYRRLFENAGYVVDHVGPAFQLGPKGRLANILLLRRFEYLFHSQIELRGHCP
jgi:2-polyprenyl-3-methyl-5-hydroxy-6-metoxy-1,4-benzoquinol methylase